MEVLSHLIATNYPHKVLVIEYNGEGINQPKMSIGNKIKIDTHTYGVALIA